jgi:hypothetical protein
MVQPMARLYGRLKHGLTPWKKRKPMGRWKPSLAIGTSHSNIWSESWRANEDWLTDIEAHLISLKARVKRGGDFDSWDLETRNGISSISRLMITIEEHGAGKQLVRMKSWNKPSKSFLFAFSFFLLMAGAAALGQSPVVALLFGLVALLFLTEFVIDTSVSIHNFKKILSHTGQNWNILQKGMTAETEEVESPKVEQKAEGVIRLRPHVRKEDEAGYELVQTKN